MLSLVHAGQPLPLRYPTCKCVHTTCIRCCCDLAAVATDDDINDIFGKGGSHGTPGDDRAPSKAHSGSSEARETKRPVAQSTGNIGRHAHTHTLHTLALFSFVEKLETDFGCSNALSCIEDKQCGLYTSLHWS